MIHLAITQSHKVALINALLVYARLKDEPQIFEDVTTDTTTSIGELLTLVSQARQVPTVNMQMLIDAGLNGFALELLSESLAGKKDIRSFRPLRFEFRGVIYTLEPAKQVAAGEPIGATT